MRVQRGGIGERLAYLLRAPHTLCTSHKPITINIARSQLSAVICLQMEFIFHIHICVRCACERWFCRRSRCGLVQRVCMLTIVLVVLLEIVWFLFRMGKATGKTAELFMLSNTLQLWQITPWKAIRRDDAHFGMQENSSIARCHNTLAVALKIASKR